MKYLIPDPGIEKSIPKLQSPLTRVYVGFIFRTFIFRMLPTLLT